MLADIVHGQLTTADILFLIAAIVAAFGAVRPVQAGNLDGALVPVALCLTALGLMFL